jgi:DNA/RNA-binding domain of Phe-tRNA-synthetase-like protein
VPLAVEADAMTEQTKNLDKAKLNEYYERLTQEFINNKDSLAENEEIVFADDDVIVKGRSMREAAKNKLLTETTILSMFKLLVPEEQGFDMSTITYDMVEELFPFSIQMELLRFINDTISPSYKETKGN